MASKSSKLYSDSPSLKRDEESGKVGVEKPSEADGENMGTEGNAIPGSGGEMPVGGEEHKAKMDEVKELYKRHEEEHTSMADRHKKSLEEMHKRHTKKDKE